MNIRRDVKADLEITSILLRLGVKFGSGKLLPRRESVWLGRDVFFLFSYGLFQGLVLKVALIGLAG